MVREDSNGQKQFELTPFSGYRITELGRQIDVRGERKLGTLFEEQKPRPTLRELDELIAQNFEANSEHYAWGEETVTDMTSRYWLEIPSNDVDKHWTFFHNGHVWFYAFVCLLRAHSGP